MPAINAQTITHVFFDLDGTLVDSFPGISFSAASAVAEVFPDRAVPDFLPFIGPPIREIFRQALREENSETLQRLEHAFRQSYDSEGWRKTSIYPGAEKVLTSLNKSGIACYVLTNKPKRPTIAILAHLGVENFFSGIITPDTRNPSYASKAEAALDARNHLGLEIHKGLIVGDSTDDAAAAEACGFRFAAVTFGYGLAHRQNFHIVHTQLEKLEDLLSDF